MYEYLRKNTSFTIDANCVTFDLQNVEATIKHFWHTQAILTLKFSGINIDFYSKGLVEYWYEDGDSCALLDLIISNKLYFKQFIFE